MYAYRLPQIVQFRIAVLLNKVSFSLYDYGFQCVCHLDRLESAVRLICRYFWGFFNLTCRACCRPHVVYAF